jgi:hypothetical protein
VGRLAERPIQVYLEREQDEAVRALAQRQEISIAELIRRSVDRYLTELPVEDDPAVDIMGLVDAGPEDASEKHDDYIVRLLQEESGQ